MIWRCCLALIVVLPAWATDAEFFESKVRPILAANCYTCHTDTAMGELRLDSLEAVLKGGKSGPVVIPGKPEESVLIQAVRRTHARLKMPPTGPLAAADVDALIEWVRRGVPWGETAAQNAPAGQLRFWAFQRVNKPIVPEVKKKAWVRTPVDAFVLARLESKGMDPVKAADRRTWLRRVTLDLTGLPPTPEEVDAFLKDRSPEAYRKVVDRLLESPHYGERWARHWLDLARYSDGLLAAGVDTPMPNAYRYRDWVVEAFNKDLPYDRFVKAQIAADLMPEDQRKELMAGLGFQALGGNANDQVDVTTKAFLGLTVGCAQCHDHKYDPIPTRDYYSLLGVFKSSAKHDYPLVDENQAKLYTEQKKKIDRLKEALDDYLIVQQKELVDLLARNTARYLVATWKQGRGEAADTAGLDEETLRRWVTYLKEPDKEHPFLKPWFEVLAQNPSEDQVRKAAEEYQKFALDLIEEAKEIDDKNYVAFGGKKGMKDERTRQYTNIVALPVLKFYQWREIASGPYNIDGYRAPAGIYYYGAKELDRWLGGHAMQYVAQLRGEIAALEKDLPPMYPFLHAMKEGPKPEDVRVAIRGDADTPGELAPRRFLSALCNGEPARFTKGSGRLELAEAISSAENPLTARVMANRVWQHHFGQGIVKTPSNFGLNGEQPTHPELLDYLAAQLVESGWSLKALHRTILLSSTYALSTANDEMNLEKDPENKLLWRASVLPRLDLEALRDSVLSVSGKLDRKLGGPPEVLSDTSLRRSLYLTVSRTRLDPTMALFDFPDPNATTDERPVTTGPLQALFFLNSKFVADQARSLEERLTREAGPEAGAKVERAYRLLYGRRPDPEELDLALKYVASGGSSWQQFLQALLGSAEFTSVN
jgi:Protein of unknown function (DUF1553)/Protein of unknown function (DUF1549)/Planctomycete cytochrome C